MVKRHPRGAPSIILMNPFLKKRRVIPQSLYLLKLSTILQSARFGNSTVRILHTSTGITLLIGSVGKDSTFPGVSPAPAIKSSLLEKWQGQHYREGYVPQFGWNQETGEPWLAIRCFAIKACPALCGKLTPVITDEQANGSRSQAGVHQTIKQINAKLRTVLREVRRKWTSAPLARV